MSSLSIHVLLTLAQLCLASISIVGKLILFKLPVDALLLIRVSSAAVIFFLLALGTSRRSSVRIHWADVPYLLVCACLAILANQAFYLYGLKHSTAVNASVLWTTAPLFTMLFAVLGGTEKLHLYRLLGMAVALVGALLLMDVKQLDLSNHHLIGNLLVLGSAVTYALYLVIVKPLTQRYPPMVLTAWLFATTVPVFLPWGFASTRLVLPQLTSHELFLLAIMVMISTVGGYALMQWALKYAESSLAGTYLYLQPVFGMIGAHYLLHEPLDLQTLIASGLILMGVALATRAISDR